MVDRSLLLHLVGDQRVALVEEKDAELLLRLMRHRCVAIVDHGAPGGQNLLVAQFAPEHAVAGGGDELEIERNGLSDAFDFLKEVQGSAEDGRKRAEAVEQRLGDRLGVAAGDEAEEDELEDFVIRQRRIPVFAVAGSQAIPMAVIVRIGCRRRRGCGAVAGPLLRENPRSSAASKSSSGSPGGIFVTRRPRRECRA